VLDRPLRFTRGSAGAPPGRGVYGTRSLRLHGSNLSWGNAAVGGDLRGRRRRGYQLAQSYVRTDGDAPSSATESREARLGANSSGASGRVGIQPAEAQPALKRGSPPRRSRDGHPALSLDPPSRRRLGDSVGKRHRRIRLRSASRQVAPMNGVEPIAQNGRANLRSPGGACPGRANVSPAPDDTGAFQRGSFMPISASDGRMPRARLS
jgi:hypothetical protein